MQNRSDAQNRQASSLSWGSIFGGVTAWASVGALLSLLGLGLGLAAFEVDADTISALSIGSIVWFVIAGTLTMFVSGWVSGHMANTRCLVKGSVHGLITWGMAFLLGLVLVGSGAGAIVVGAGQMIGKTLEIGGKATALMAPAAASSMNSETADKLMDNITQQADEWLDQINNNKGQPSQDEQNSSQQSAQADNKGDKASTDSERPTNNPQHSIAQAEKQNAQSQEKPSQAAQSNNSNADEAFQSLLNPSDETKAKLNDAIKNYLSNTDQNAAQDLRNTLVQQLTQNSELSQAQAEQVIDKWQQNYEQAVAKAKQAANDASNVLSGVALASFFTMLIGAIASVLGAAWATALRRKHELPASL